AERVFRTGTHPLPCESTASAVSLRGAPAAVQRHRVVATDPDAALALRDSPDLPSRRHLRALEGRPLVRASRDEAGGRAGDDEAPAPIPYEGARVGERRAT